MIVIVKRHEILLKKEEEINEKEVNVSKCIFEFDEEITDEFIKEAIFVKDDKTIVKIINNNECDYPPEILDSVGACLLGVVATLTEGEEIVKRFNPTPKKFFITEGILREADNSEPITASELEQYQQALQNGLNEVKAELQRVIETGNTVASQGQYAQEQGDYAKEQAQIIIDSNAVATKIIKEFEENVEQHTTNFNENATTQTTNYNDNAKEKLETYNSNAETKTTDFNKNASDKTKTFNENVETKITDYNANSEVKIKAYDDNAIAKLKEYNDNATLKVEEYNSNATEKLENYNSNATAKTEEFNQNASNYEKRITENEKDIIDIESYLDSLTPKAPPVKGELVHITDALGLPVFETKTSGNVKQETTQGYNLANVLNFQNNDILTVNANQSLTLANNPQASGYTETNVTLGNLAPDLVAGDTIYLHLETTFTSQASIYIYGGTRLYDGSSVTVTEEMLTKKVVLYGGATKIDTIRLQFTKDELKNVWEPYTGGQASPNPEFPQEIEVIEGYNLFDASELVQGNINTTTGEEISSNYAVRTPYIDVSGGTNYTINGSYTGAGSFNISILQFASDNTFIEGENKNAAFPNFITNENTRKIRIAIYSDAGTKPTNFDELFPEFQLVKGTQKPYLPYGCIGYKVNGKNLFDLNYAIEKNYLPNGSETSLSYTIDNNGYLNNTGTNANVGIRYLNKISLKAGTYTLQYVLNLTTTGERVVLIRAKNFTTNTEIIDKTEWNLGTGDISRNFTFTLSEDSEIGFAFTPKNGTSTLVIKDIQLELGDKATEIEDYQEQIVYLDLKGNWVGKINDNIKDYLVTDKKKFWLVKNVGKIVLDGSETYTDISIRTNTIRCLCKLTGGVSYTSITSHLIYRNNIYSSDIEGQLLEKNYLVLSLPISIVGNTSNALKTWLSNNNIEVYYQLAEPQIIDLGELPEPIKTFEGTNNIQVLANLDTEIEVKYALDLKKYYDNKLAEISAQII